MQSAYLLIYDRIDPLPDIEGVSMKRNTVGDGAASSSFHDARSLYTNDEHQNTFVSNDNVGDAMMKSVVEPYFDLTRAPLPRAAVQEFVPSDLLLEIHTKNQEYIHEQNIFSESWVNGIARLFDIAGCRFFPLSTFIPSSGLILPKSPLAIPRYTFLRVWLCFLLDTYLHYDKKGLLSFWFRNMESLISMDLELAQFFVNELIIQLFPISGAALTHSWLQEVYLKCGDPSVTIPFSKLLLSSMRILYVHGTWEELSIRTTVVNSDEKEMEVKDVGDFDFLPVVTMENGGSSDGAEPPLPFTSCLCSTYIPSQKNNIMKQIFHSPSLLLLNHLIYVLLMLIPCNQPRIFMLSSLFLVLRDFASFGSLASLFLMVHEYPRRVVDFVLGDSSSYDFNKNAKQNPYNLNRRNARLPEKNYLSAMKALVSSCCVVVSILFYPLKYIYQKWKSLAKEEKEIDESNIEAKGAIRKNFFLLVVHFFYLQEFVMGEWSNGHEDKDGSGLQASFEPTPPFLLNKSHGLNAKQLFFMIVVGIVRGGDLGKEEMKLEENLSLIRDCLNMCQEFSASQKFIFSEYVLGSGCHRELACAVVGGNSVLELVKIGVEKLRSENNYYYFDSIVDFILTLVCMISYSMNTLVPSSSLDNNHPSCLEVKKKASKAGEAALSSSPVFTNSSPFMYFTSFNNEQHACLNGLLEILRTRRTPCLSLTCALAAYSRVCPPLREYLVNNVEWLVQVCVNELV
jgi:hypothetical protein